MPRLIGKQTNSGGYIALLLLAAIGAVGVMEYAGAIDMIPHFGSDYVGDPGLSSQNRRPHALENPPDNQPFENQQPAIGHQPPVQSAPSVVQPGPPTSGQIYPQPNTQLTEPNPLPSSAY